MQKWEVLSCCALSVGKKGSNKKKCFRLIDFPSNFRFNKGKLQGGGSGGSAVNSLAYANQFCVIHSEDTHGQDGSCNVQSLSLSKDQVQRLMIILC